MEAPLISVTTETVGATELKGKIKAKEQVESTFLGEASLPFLTNFSFLESKEEERESNCKREMSWLEEEEEPN